jgi:hypothetical protein
MAYLVPCTVLVIVARAMTCGKAMARGNPVIFGVAAASWIFAGSRISASCASSGATSRNLNAASASSKRDPAGNRQYVRSGHYGEVWEFFWYAKRPHTIRWRVTAP